MFEIWPVMGKCTVVAKKELFYAWPFGLAAWLCGLIFIDRLNSESSRQTINNSMDQLKKDKVSGTFDLKKYMLIVLHILDPCDNVYFGYLCCFV